MCVFGTGVLMSEVSGREASAPSAGEKNKQDVEKKTLTSEESLAQHKETSNLLKIENEPFLVFLLYDQHLTFLTFK